MQNLACTYPIFMKHNPIFSQKCSDFSVFCPPLDFCGKILEKYTDRSKIQDYGNLIKGLGGPRETSL